MIAKTLEEKEQLKKAKAEYRQGVKDRVKQAVDRAIDNNKLRERLEANPPISTGLLDTEKELAYNYPVYFNYLYVAKFKDNYKVIRSDVQGTIAYLKRDLGKIYNMFPDAIYSCDLKRRNLL